MPKVYSVREITGRIKDAIEDAFPFILVKGQVSNLSRPSSGHIYFTLRDEDAALSVVWFRGAQRQNFNGGFDPLTGEVYEEGERPNLAALLENGQEIICGGQVTVYAPRGSYQLVAELVENVGLGQLHLEFEAMKQRYLEKGYFNPERKRPLPKDPRRVAVVTAPTGAAIQDFLRISSERGLAGEIRIYPALVQGEHAPGQVSKMLKKACQDKWADVVVLIRGGGSLEDLWTFNSEPVAEAVYEASVPVVAGIGHEVDTSIADMIADVRAATPTHAAQLLFADRRVLEQKVDTGEMALTRAWERWVAFREQQLAAMERHLALLSPKARIERVEQTYDALQERFFRATDSMLERRDGTLLSLSQRLSLLLSPERITQREHGVDRLSERLESALNLSVLRKEQALEHASALLQGLNPEAPLERGYSLVRVGKSGKFLRSAADVSPGDSIEVMAKDGRVAAEVLESHINRDGDA